MDNQTIFLSNIRSALGEAPRSERPKQMFPKLFSSPNTAKILEKIRSRTVEEQNLLVEILQKNGNSLNICSHIVHTFNEAAAVVVDLIRTKDPEFNYTKHVVLHDHPDIAALQLWNRFEPRSRDPAHHLQLGSTDKRQNHSFLHRHNCSDHRCRRFSYFDPID